MPGEAENAPDRVHISLVGHAGLSQGLNRTREKSVPSFFFRVRIEGTGMTNEKDNIVYPCSVAAGVHGNGDVVRRCETWLEWLFGLEFNRA